MDYEHLLYIIDLYEQEDAYWKEVLEEFEADYWVAEHKNGNFES